MTKEIEVLDKVIAVNEKETGKEEDSRLIYCRANKR